MIKQPLQTSLSPDLASTFSKPLPPLTEEDLFALVKNLAASLPSDIWVDLVQRSEAAFLSSWHCTFQALSGNNWKSYIATLISPPSPPSNTGIAEKVQREKEESSSTSPADNTAQPERSLATIPS